MDLRHVCHFVAETLRVNGGALLGEEAGAVQAHVTVLGAEAGIVVLAVERREYELIVREITRRPVTPLDCPSCEETSRMNEYKKVRLRRPFRHGAMEITALEFVLGQPSPEASVCHVRGTCAGDIPFAGFVAMTEDDGVPAHDLRSFGAPLDLDELAAAIRRICA
jgi:hypothetical protein